MHSRTENILATLSLTVIAVTIGTATGSWIVFAIALAFILGTSLWAEVTAEGDKTRKPDCAARL